MPVCRAVGEFSAIHCLIVLAVILMEADLLPLLYFATSAIF